MSFTYAGSLATDKEKVRFYIGDTTLASGPKPASGNFTDEELTALITLEGSWQRAVAACFEALASAWAIHPNFTADGVSVSQSATAAHYQAQADKWRREAGSGTVSTSGVVAVTRIDGYSYDVTNEETDDDDYSSADYLR
jgi:hypothetical protein